MTTNFFELICQASTIHNELFHFLSRLYETYYCCTGNIVYTDSMQHRRHTKQAYFWSLIIGLFVFGPFFGLNTMSDMSGRTGNISVATAFVSSSSVNGDTASMKGKGPSDTDELDHAAISETGTIKQSIEAATPVPLLLPPGDESDENITSIKLGETISFAELGPIILNTDGTTRRIDNWKTLTKQEQETTWRRIQKRNAERRQQLLLEQEQQKEAENLINDSNTE